MKLFLTWFVIVPGVVIGSGVALFAALALVWPMGGVIRDSGGIALWLYSATWALAWWEKRAEREPRDVPPDYVGKFRRPNGAIVHVMRVSGVLMMASDEKPGVTPQDLGTVDGREMMQWERLATIPGWYGEHGIASTGESIHPR